MVLPRTTPSWWGATVPVVGPTGTATTWVCARYVFNAPGRIFGLRFYDGFAGKDGVLLTVVSDETGSQRWTRANVYVASGAMANGWRQKWIRPAHRVTVGTIYTVAALYVGGGFFRTNNQVASLGTPVYHGHIGLYSSMQNTNLNLPGSGFVENLNANAVDVLFQHDV